MILVVGAALAAGGYIAYVTDSFAAGVIGGFIVGVVVTFMLNPKNGD